MQILRRDKFDTCKYVALTIDGSTKNDEAIVAIAGHVIDDNWTLCVHVLGAIPNPTAQSAEEVSQFNFFLGLSMCV